MITYAEPTYPANEREAEQLRIMLNNFKQVTANPSKDLEVLYYIFTQFLPIQHIVITFTGPWQKDGQYYIHPDPHLGKKQFSLHATSEQTQVLRHTHHRVIRMGNNSDHSIVLGLLNQIFANTSFYVLTVRTILENDVIATITCVCMNKSFTEHNVNLLFSVFQELHTIMTSWSELYYTNTQTSDNAYPNHLPLIKLPGMAKINEMIWSVARQNCPIILYGETGTGKEIVADTIYKASARVYGPFIKVNCGSIPESLVDSELFGHEKGAFTDAVTERKGCFERADRGILLLDEIGELPSNIQARMLRVLQEGTFTRVGGSKEKVTDVRIIAATHRNLREMVLKFQFREDLFHRLNVFTMFIPALRDRPEDIPILLDFFIKQKCFAQGLPLIPTISSKEVETLMAYSWPGNIRELNNIVERAIILWAYDTRKDFHMEIEAFSPNSFQSAENSLLSLDEAMAKHISKALKMSKGRINGSGGAAEILKIHPNTLRARIAKLGLLES